MTLRSRCWPVLVALSLVACGAAVTTPTAKATGPTTGKVGESLAFDGSRSSDPSGTLASLHWEFGDNSALDGASVKHSFAAPGTYTVILTVRNGQGRSGRDQLTVTIGGDAPVPPTAKISGPATGQIGEALSFDGSGSSGVNGISSYAWSFGDSSAATGDKATHLFTANGQYAVRLTVTDSAGQSGVATLTVSIGVVAGNRNPVASAGKDLAGRTGQLVKLDGSASYDPDSGDRVASYDWDFGDGSAHASDVKPSHAWTTVGTFTVTLKVTDTRGGSDSTTLRAVITPPPDYAGRWIFNPTPASVSCSGGGYQLGFPAVTLDFQPSGTSIIVVDPSVGARRLTGTLTDPDFSATVTFSEGGACGTRTVTETLTARFSSDRALTGSYNVFHSYASDARCNCSAIFQVTAGKQ